MDFDIAPNSANPIYRQIVEQVQRRVASGQLPPGADLPSVRAVALQHAINPMTVSKAYSLLEAQGVLERRRGVGMVVADQGALRTSGPDTLALLQPTLAIAAQAVRQLGIDDEAALQAFAQALAKLPP
ncbi:MAG: GntR family transcriptional regulator [Candidatus Saccharibacteria bacterium]|nr:GntR family transcriptional regulator [Rhodoferax sp.]